MYYVIYILVVVLESRKVVNTHRVELVDVVVYELLDLVRVLSVLICLSNTRL